MKLDMFKSKLESMVYEACVAYIDKIKNNFENERVYAFTILVDSGFVSMDVAFATSQSLRRHVKDAEISDPSCFIELAAPEWEYVNDFYELFILVDEELDVFFEGVYDGSLADEMDQILTEGQQWDIIYNVLTQVVINVLLKLRNEKKFENNISFEEDVFLGLQYMDPDKGQFFQMEKVSEELNSDVWHSKFLCFKEYCNQ